ncbi:MAG: WecB/TagA/CpsF family glycosyltransferase [Candidatus Omnitrophica bacterium]|nr:WecB/TagA/CpsF family glycosyltransferase [Candidatus Omnitrophota bacterium]
MKRTPVNICGIEINNITFEELLINIHSFILKGRQAYVVTPNVDHIVCLQKNPQFRDIYRNADLVIADGVPLLWAARFLGTPLKGKISGSDLFPRLCEIAAAKGYRLFFLGGSEGSASRSAEVLKMKHPKINIVGVYSPPFDFESSPSENQKIVEMIKESKADILFVGLGAPKQEKWIFEHKGEYKVPLSIGIGASFEFASGKIKRAPLWMQKAGLEWFWRLSLEPKRLWKRYLITDMSFFWLVIRQRFFR